MKTKPQCIVPWANISIADAVQFVELDCGHYVHHFEYERISKDMKEFIEGLGK